ncbi:hypothetical protein KKC08_04490 [Patescibacteria group bacterium]|nr:hypothetical protein [Patescibacteria group bacterium]MCG2702396.1 hypothetical protein [Candidatus Parcubacteria bacterium]MBU4264833.1 hypothetical protein [Patescibacteria group bacterium]MBU4389704.1 hypothetical protein [Patescibacteria group bacterium]MBU4397399.1 hypothetical protein [Patescibacteria group bacterium]
MGKEIRMNVRKFREVVFTIVVAAVVLGILVVAVYGIMRGIDYVFTPAPVPSQTPAPSAVPPSPTPTLRQEAPTLEPEPTDAPTLPVASPTPVSAVELVVRDAWTTGKDQEQSGVVYRPVQVTLVGAIAIESVAGDYVVDNYVVSVAEDASSTTINLLFVIDNANAIATKVVVNGIILTNPSSGGKEFFFERFAGPTDGGGGDVEPTPTLADPPRP